jgi:hypothetical protein
MQCSRCNSPFSEIRSNRTRFNRAKSKYLTSAYRPAPALPNGTIDASWVSEVGDDTDLAPGTFLQTYKSILFICAISGMFCASAIIYLGYSVLHLGIVGVPFLVIFAAGLALSIGLPFKMLKEHAVITRG